MEHILPEQGRVWQSLRGGILIKSAYEMEIFIPVTIGCNMSTGLLDLLRYVPAFGCGSYLYPAYWCTGISFPNLFYQVFKKPIHLLGGSVSLYPCNIIGHKDNNGVKLMRFNDPVCIIDKIT